MAVNWLRGLDLNQRPSGYEPDRFVAIALICLIYSSFKANVFVVVFVLACRMFVTFHRVLDVAMPATKSQPQTERNNYAT